jgi:predicted homoserine dehydrogenase-like protein
VTGTVEFAARVTEKAIEYGKHVILMNAELDGTLGPVLKAHADKAGVVFSNADGDQPGVIMNLYRFVRGIGAKPVLCGNIKGLQDRYRTPATQAAFARKWGQKAQMVTSFADGTKISFEQAVVANATGMRVARRGMLGPTLPPGTPLVEAIKQYPLETLAGGSGIVDYLVGADPAPGVFVLGTHDHPTQQHFLNLFKMGEGPVYCFSTPYHLCHFELPNSVARAVLFHDAAIAPLGPPCVDVVATAKKDLRAGDVLDGMGGFASYGQCENSDIVRSEGLLPMGLAEGCRLNHDIDRDQAIRFGDVTLPGELRSHQLWNEQNALFGL